MLSSWERDPYGNTPYDLEFIEQVRRTDLPPGSFFVMVFPLKGYGHGTYAWKLCLPEAGEAKKGEANDN